MPEIKYYKDLNHSYIIFKDHWDQGKNSFRLKMIAENQLRCFLPCSVKNVNNQSLLYYEISSKQSFRNMADIRELDFGQLAHFFESLEEAIKEAKEYLLQSNGILLHPDYIFLEPEKQYFQFIYYPYSDHDENMFLEFGEFLIQRVDHEDNRAVQIAYNVYELTQNEAFVLPEILKLFQADKDRERSEAVPEEKTDLQQDHTLVSNIPNSSILSKSSNPSNKGIDPPDEISYEDLEEQPEEETQAKKKKNRITWVLFLMSIFAAGVLIYIRYPFALSQTESLLATLGAFALLVTAVVLLLYLAANPVRGYSIRKNPAEQAESSRGSKRTSWDEGQSATLYDEVLPDPKSAWTEEKKLDPPVNHEEIYGNTIFIPGDPEQRENKLYSLGKGNKRHIYLDQLPCVVGKMAGGVDVVIKHESISRIHARFSCVDGNIYITDLNATNGTYKNGLRMEPNSSLLLEPGDEIRLGKLDYVFR